MAEEEPNRMDPAEAPTDGEREEQEVQEVRGQQEGGGDADVPEPVVDRAETLTRRAREAVDPAEREAYLDERDEVVADHDYVARVREDEDDETLVLHPDEWLEDGVVRIDRIEDTDRAVERPLSGAGTAEDDDWEAIEAHNRAVAERVRERHGEAHGANAHAFADFMANHHRKRVEDATSDEREVFLAEYFVRNAWPTDDQRAAVERSLELVMETAASL